MAWLGNGLMVAGGVAFFAGYFTGMAGVGSTFAGLPGSYLMMGGAVTGAVGLGIDAASSIL